MAAAIVKFDTYPPSANRIWRYVNGRAIKSAEYRTWREAQEWAVKAQREPTVIGAYTAHIMVNRPDNRKRDLDNLLKPIGDVLVAAGIVEDDSLCQKLTVEWVRGQSCPVKCFIISTEVR